MGMSIDLALDIFKHPTDYFPSEKEDADKFAIITMKKYQKIEQIVKDHDNDRMPENYWYIDKIREVLKDGNGVSKV